MAINIVNKILESDHKSAEDLFSTKSSIYTFLNPVSYLTAIKRPELFDRFNGILIDGSILVSAIRLLYGRKIQRRSFDMTSVAASLFRHIQAEEKSIYLIGAKQQQIEHSVGLLMKQYPDIKIAGYRNGYFSSEDQLQETITKIIDINPDYVIAGMGTPEQEVFLLKLQESGFKGIGFTCGGFISQLSMKGIAYYPAWADRYNIRFLYRFYKEKHTRERYMKAALLFPVHFIWNRFRQ